MADAFVAGQKLTAAFLNNLFKGSGGWEPYTPVWGSNAVAPAIGNGTIVGRYAKAGRIAIARIDMTIGSTSTFGTGVYTWSLPFTVASLTAIAEIVDISASARFSREGFALSSTTVALHTEAGVYVGPTSPMTWATSDAINIHVIGESLT